MNNGSGLNVILQKFAKNILVLFRLHTHTHIYIYIYIYPFLNIFPQNLISSFHHKVKSESRNKHVKPWRIVRSCWRGADQ
jgi:hypothetical protein